MDSQFLGGLEPVPVISSKGVDDQFPLIFIHQLQGVSWRRSGLWLKLFRQVTDLDYATGAKDETVFDDIFQLPHVSWITVVH